MEKKIEQLDDEIEVKEGQLLNDKPSQSGNQKAIWLVLIIVFGLNIGLYWHWFQQQQLNSEIELALAEILQPIVPDTSFLDHTSALEEQFQTAITALKSEQLSLADDVDGLRASQTLASADVEYYWLMAEVKYLLNLANQQALLAKDAAGAREAIELADNRIESLSDHRLHPLRALLAAETLALSAVNRVDVEGLTLQIQSTLHNIDNLQVLLAASIDNTSEELTAQQNNENWQAALGSAWQQVKSLVVIRHQQDGAAAVLVPEQRYFLYQNLRLKLETVRYALSSGNQSIYDSSLNSATQWLQQYFVGAERDAMLHSLEELKENKIEVTLPDISASLTWLRGFDQ